jgi:hypothetical protein
MPQELDATTGNIITQNEQRADPAVPLAYRTGITVADGAGRPAANSALFAVNPGFRAVCRVFVESSGSPTSCTVRPYLRSGGSGGHAGTGPVQTLAGAPNFDTAFDVLCAGDDLAVLVESLAGGSSPALSIYLSWR